MIKILLVDDENLILYSLSSALRRRGHDVTAVTNGTGALDAIRSSSYDVCFLDVRLPDANGLELMPVMRNISPETKIIIMTAEDLGEKKLEDLRGKGCSFLPKPFDLDHVHALIAGAGKAAAGSISLRT